ncbi:uncharacterized protein [Argopecten irradians]|uniref:uncharacterized protein n=1 Tax=Argopecten irradians TaxID=31199 RepID=UPI0037233BBD
MGALRTQIIVCLFLVIALCALSEGKSKQKTETISYLKSELLCEHKKKKIRCDGGKVINITKAFYGRHKKSICPRKSVRTTKCEAKSSMSKVREACEGKETCHLSASNSVFGDPCKGTVKYLKVQYACSNPAAGFVTISTPKQRPTYSYTNLNEYNYTLDGRKTFEFEAKACNGAYIALMGPGGEKDKLYEILIGGLQNSKSVIRTRKQGPEVCFNRGRYLDSHQYRRFKVTWYNGEIKVLWHVHNEWTKFMEWRDPKPLHVKSIGVSGGLLADVSWKIKIQGRVSLLKLYMRDLMYFCPLVGDGFITLDTPKQHPTYSYTNLNEYNYTLDGRKTLKFEAKACNDVHVALMGPEGEKDKLYEIVLGGWQNSKSIIRTRKQGPEVCFNPGGYLDCHQYRRFKVTWYNGEIKVLRYVNNVWTKCMDEIYGVDGPETTRQTETISYLKSELLCEHKKKTIRCDGGKVINITKAFYGRHKKSICPRKSVRTTKCEAKSSMSKVREACEGKETCHLSASNSVFGDPCKGTVKYLKVQYACSNPAAGFVTISTPKQRPTYSYTNLKEYNYTLDGRKNFEFEAKACNGAYIALMGPGGEKDKLYEILIRGLQNSKSVIRTRKQGPGVCFNRGRYLDSHQYRRFKVTWYNGEIKVLWHVHNEWTKFMEWRDPKPLDVKSIGVSGGLWADVSWKIKIQGDRFITIDTPKQHPTYSYTNLNEYNYTLNGKKTLKFEAKACNDVHVALMGPGGEKDKLYEIVIGGRQNSKSVIRIRKQGPEVCFNPGRYLDCRQYRRFKVTWYNCEIKVLWHVHNEWTKFMEWRDPKPLDVKSIGVSGGLWADVSWKIIK